MQCETERAVDSQVASRNTKGLEDKDYCQRLNRLDLYSIKGRLLRADLIKC